MPTTATNKEKEVQQLEKSWPKADMSTRSCSPLFAIAILDLENDSPVVEKVPNFVASPSMFNASFENTLQREENSHSLPLSNDKFDLDFLEDYVHREFVSDAAVTLQRLDSKKVTASRVTKHFISECGISSEEVNEGTSSECGIFSEEVNEGKGSSLPNELNRSKHPPDMDDEFDLDFLEDFVHQEFVSDAAVTLQRLDSKKVTASRVTKHFISECGISSEEVNEGTSSECGISSEEVNEGKGSSLPNELNRSKHPPDMDTSHQLSPTTPVCCSTTTTTSVRCEGKGSSLPNELNRSKHPPDMDDEFDLDFLEDFVHQEFVSDAAVTFQRLDSKEVTASRVTKHFISECGISSEEVNEGTSSECGISSEEVNEGKGSSLPNELNRSKHPPDMDTSHQLSPTTPVCCSTTTTTSVRCMKCCYTLYQDHCRMCDHDEWIEMSELRKNENISVVTIADPPDASHFKSIPRKRKREAIEFESSTTCSAVGEKRKNILSNLSYLIGGQFSTIPLCPYECNRFVEMSLYSKKTTVCRRCKATQCIRGGKKRKPIPSLEDSLFTSTSKLNSKMTSLSSIVLNSILDVVRRQDGDFPKQFCEASILKNFLKSVDEFRSGRISAFVPFKQFSSSCRWFTSKAKKQLYNIVFWSFGFIVDAIESCSLVGILDLLLFSLRECSNEDSLDLLKLFSGLAFTGDAFAKEIVSALSRGAHSKNFGGVGVSPDMTDKKCFVKLVRLMFVSELCTAGALYKWFPVFSYNSDFANRNSDFTFALQSTEFRHLIDYISSASGFFSDGNFRQLFPLSVSKLAFKSKSKNLLLLVVGYCGHILKFSNSVRCQAGHVVRKSNATQQNSKLALFASSLVRSRGVLETTVPTHLQDFSLVSDKAIVTSLTHASIMCLSLEKNRNRTLWYQLPKIRRDFLLSLSFSAQSDSLYGGLLPRERVKTLSICLEIITCNPGWHSDSCVKAKPLGKALLGLLKKDDINQNDAEEAILFLNSFIK